LKTSQRRKGKAKKTKTKAHATALRGFDVLMQTERERYTSHRDTLIFIDTHTVGHKQIELSLHISPFAAVAKPCCCMLSQWNRITRERATRRDTKIERERAATACKNENESRVWSKGRQTQKRDFLILGLNHLKMDLFVTAPKDVAVSVYMYDEMPRMNCSHVCQWSLLDVDSCFS